MRSEIAGPGYSSRAQRTFTLTGRLLEALHLDGPLLLARARSVRRRDWSCSTVRPGEDLGVFLGQAARVGLGFGVMIAVAQIPPRVMRIGAPFLYGARRAAAGRSRGHRRHRDGRAALARPRRRALPALRTAEDRRAARLRVVPARAAAAAGFHDARACSCPPMLVPTLLIAEQPDLGTALLVAAGGALVVLLGGPAARATSSASARS